MKDAFVLDACALIALTNKEKGADIVADILKHANHGSVRLYMNRVNLYEVYYGFYREYGKEYALNVIENVEDSPVLVAEFDREIFLEADHHEFDAIEGKENLIFNWIR